MGNSTVFFSVQSDWQVKDSVGKNFFLFRKIFTTFPENIIYPRSEIFSNPRKETKNDKKQMPQKMKKRRQKQNKKQNTLKKQQKGEETERNTSKFFS